MKMKTQEIMRHVWDFDHTIGQNTLVYRRVATITYPTFESLEDIINYVRENPDKETMIVKGTNQGVHLQYLPRPSSYNKKP